VDSSRLKPGFYKKEKNYLLYAKNKVSNKNYILLITEKDSYEYPVDNWYYFDDEDTAYKFFNLEKPKEEALDEFV
jgi:hypothetical protein